MTAKELIDQLILCDPNAKVLINVRQYNKTHEVCQLSEIEVTHFYEGCTIDVSLPYGWYTVVGRDAADHSSKK